MAYKSSGKAGKSASGASMSKYDVEVEERLQALEAPCSHLGCASASNA
jgi:Rieske Fe-S protein